MQDGEDRKMQKMCWLKDVDEAVGRNHWLDILSMGIHNFTEADSRCLAGPFGECDTKNLRKPDGLPCS